MSGPRSVWLVSLFAGLVLGCGDAPTEEDAGVDAGLDAARPDAARADAGPLPPCGTESPLALSQCVESARYDADLATVAMPREPESAHWQAVQDLCATRLTELGFEVERHAYATGVNVIGVRAGTTEPDRRVLVAAHYDHIPGCQGADDNASGVAGVLEAARVLAMSTHARTLVVACWDEEERGLIGSRAYAVRARARDEVIDAHFNFEMIGYRDDAPDSQRLPTGFDIIFRQAAREWEANDRRADFVAVIADPASDGNVDALETYADRIGLPFIPLRVSATLLDSPATGDLRRSDHASFWAEGYPGMMITDTSEFRYDAYHCRSAEDAIANLDTEFSTQIIAITVAAAADALAGR